MHYNGHNLILQAIAFYHLKCYRSIIVHSNDNVTEETMSETEQMSVNERRKYLHKMRIRYWQVKTKKERNALLDEMQAVTSLHRKSIIRLIKGELAQKPRRKQRGKTYDSEVKTTVEKIAQSLDCPCAERLQPNLVWMADHLNAHKEIELLPEIRTKLERISVSTVRRLLPPSQRAATRIAHRKGQPRESFAQRQAIPMRRIPWDESVPGHFETDYGTPLRNQRFGAIDLLHK